MARGLEKDVDYVGTVQGDTTKQSIEEAILGVLMDIRDDLKTLLAYRQFKSF